MKEVYKGSDIPKAFPKSEGFWIQTTDGKPIENDGLYIIHHTRWTPKYMEVEFEPLKVWEGDKNA